MRDLIEADLGGITFQDRRDFRGSLRANEFFGQRHKNGERRQQLAQKRHRQSDDENRPPDCQTERDAAYTESCESESCQTCERDGARGRLQNVRGEIRREVENGREDHDFASLRWADLRSAIFWVRRSSWRRSRTALSTMPMTSCSAEPPQKRSMMCFTARTATFWRGSAAR